MLLRFVRRFGAQSSREVVLNGLRDVIDRSAFTQFLYFFILATFINPSCDAISRFIPTTAVTSFSVRSRICNIRWSRSSARLANLACPIKMKLAIRIASKDKQVPKREKGNGSKCETKPERTILVSTQNKRPAR